MPEYEKLVLMEMTMSGNEAYLDRFYKDLEDRRFSLIISEAISLELKDEHQAISEENNIWIRSVIRPLIKKYHYQPLQGRSDIYILTPKQ